MITQYAVSFNQKEQTMKTIPQILSAELNQPEAYIPVSYTHLTLPTNLFV